MPPKELFVVSDEEKEIRDFLRKAIKAGTVSVSLDSEQYLLNIRLEKISDEGKRILLEGGPGGLD